MTRPRPALVDINAATGAVAPATGQYEKRLSEMKGVYRDTKAWADAVRDLSDPVVYRVIEFRQDGSDVFFGTTTMQPGKIGDEFYMTRGHFHRNREMGEVYCTLSGRGLLLFESRDGQTETVEMREGTCAFIPPDWAHRSINTGDAPLVFTWFCNPEAGHDYGPILEKGMRKLVVEKDGVVDLIANPNFG